jgi:peptidyl-prolyl cis-trans isomerase C
MSDLTNPRVLALLLTTLCLLIAAGPARSEAESVAARVNGVEIGTDRLDQTFVTYLQRQRIAAPALGRIDVYRSLREDVLETLIAQELLWQRAESQGYVATDEEVEEAFSKMRESLSQEDYRRQLEQAGLTEAEYKTDLKHRMSVEKMIALEVESRVEVSDEEVRAFYESNPEAFARPEEAHVRHILISVPEDADEATREAARSKAEKALARAREPGADFGALAQEYSDDTSASDGGDLGFVRAEVLVEPFAEAAFALEPGQISDVVESPFGLHIILVEARRGGDTVPLEEVSDRIRELLREQKTQQALADLIDELRELGKVEIVESL